MIDNYKGIFYSRNMVTFGGKSAIGPLAAGIYRDEIA